MRDMLSLAVTLTICTAVVGVLSVAYLALVGEHPRALPGETPDDDLAEHELFHPRKWRKRTVAGPAVPPAYNRPAEIEIPGDAVLPPPRPIEGRNGE
jgi:hypothetical protein